MYVFVEKYVFFFQFYVPRTERACCFGPVYVNFFIPWSVYEKKNVYRGLTDGDFIVGVHTSLMKPFQNIDVCETLMPPFPNLSRIGLTFDLDL